MTPKSVALQAADEAGLWYGAQTLRQLLQGEATAATVPCLLIEDAPRYCWRGLHLDVGRHLYPLDFLRKTLDLMALHKLNLFHWHLTEDQGWRIEIKGWPRLTEVGAQRAESPLPADRNMLDRQPYGGYYTQDEVRALVAYARERHITFLPEIEMPGHAQAALASYPQLGCRGAGYEVRRRWGISDEVFCAGNDEVFDFLRERAVRGYGRCSRASTFTSVATNARRRAGRPARSARSACGRKACATKRSCKAGSSDASNAS